VWHTFNTNKFPFRGDNVVQFGCPFCGEKNIHSRIKEDMHGFRDVTEKTQRALKRKPIPLSYFEVKPDSSHD
jgi:hypothetical protein